MGNTPKQHTAQYCITTLYCRPFKKVTVAVILIAVLLRLIGIIARLLLALLATGATPALASSDEDCRWYAERSHYNLEGGALAQFRRMPAAGCYPAGDKTLKILGNFALEGQ